jgi:DsbC/DsbD-like thiol-disulfide interchange protein
MMMLGRSVIALISLASVASASVRSGKAAADWISTSGSYQPGTPVQTALRLVIDAGFHTYWSNPGESGMKLAVKWDLPPGWTAGELEHPIPERFETSGLANFGYKGTVIFPVKLTPPAEAAGPVKLAAEVSWLNCDDSSCIPGEAALSLPLEPGPPVATAAAPEIEGALARVPRPKELPLSLAENPETLLLTIRAADPAIDLGKHEVFPVTPDVLDPAATIRFTRQDAAWTAEVAKSEYFKKPLTELELVFAGPGGASPFALSWKAD